MIICYLHLFLSIERWSAVGYAQNFQQSENRVGTSYTFESVYLFYLACPLKKVIIKL